MSLLTKEQVDPKFLENETLDLAQYWQTISRYMWRILSLAIFITILVTLIVLSIVPQYNAKATLLIESDQAKVTSIEEVYGLDSSRKEYFQTQYEILKSRQVAEKVVAKLNLTQYSSFNLEMSGQSGGLFSGAMDNTKSYLQSVFPFLPQKEIVTLTSDMIALQEQRYAVEQVMEALNIEPLINTQVVRISFENEDPSLAADIANTVGDVYIENYLEAKLDMTAKATTWLNESLQGLRTKLDIAEQKLSDFYEREQLVNIDGVVGLAAEKLQRLSGQLLEAQNSLERNQAIFNQISAQEVSIEELSNLPEVLNHPSMLSVKNAELNAQSKVSELSNVYGPKHPKMISAIAELDSVSLNRNNQIRALISGITNEYNSARNKAIALDKEVEIAKVEFRKLSTLENQAKALQREVDINQQLYNSFFTRLKETNELGGFESANARILDAAQVPTIPSKPKKGLIIAAAFIVSLGFGIFLSLALEALNSGIRSVEDVERKLGQRMLGIIPWQPHKKSKTLPVRHFFDTKHHMFSESVRTLRTSLQLLNIDKPSKTILITLAYAIGQLNKVLLIDTDLRRPTLAKQFGFPGFQPGVANLVAGTHSLAECIVTDDYSNVDLICAGTIPPNPQEILASNKFKQLINELKDKYDHIILDSAPTQAVSDAMVVSNVCDSVVYVVRSDSTSDKIINNGLSRFLQIGHRVDGVVLNQVDLKKAKKTGEYSGFYDQYGYNSYSTETKSS
jgi:succinoglycan biosynthesis transport protein ExoP